MTTYFFSGELRNLGYGSITVSSSGLITCDSPEEAEREGRLQVCEKANKLGWAVEPDRVVLLALNDIR